MSAAIGGARRAAHRSWRVPGPPLIALGLVSLIGLVAALPAGPERAAHVLAGREILVSTAADGSSTVRDLSSGAVVGHVPATGPSFARGLFHSMRGFRRLHGANLDGPYELAELSDGRLVLRDGSTNTTIDLEGFGAGNAGTFTPWLGLAPTGGPR